ncbi:MAG TPA: arylsulfatase [Pyrinomonadaceae bacterium]|nr:arylsulfatase [Pyrinomonadaceae bacterium]
MALIHIPAQAQRAERKPNIILILADDLGYGDLGSYGQRFFRTPNLDRMAQEGLRFTEFYAAAPVCAPSRASLMTSLHQGHAYIRGNTDVNNRRVSLRPQDVTVAEVLKTVGYRTGIIGKWGLGEPDTTGVPNRKGFDYWFGYLNQNHAHNYYPDYLWRNEERVNIPKGTYSHDLFTREALDFIRRERASPFFLYLAYTIPHANNELTRKTGNGMEVPDDAPYSKESWRQQEKNYAAMIWRMDADIGKIFALLKELKLDDDTIVIFTSDNGPQGKDEGGYDQTFFNSNGGLRGIKRELYEGGIREPMIVRWPGKVKSGQTSDLIWTQLDFMPTFATIAGAKSPAGIDGVSMLPALLGQRPPNHKRPPDHLFLYWEFHEGGYAQAVRMGRWKAVRHGVNGVIELYDLQTDPKETNNLAAKQPALIKRIEEIMKREHVESEHWPDR